MRISNVSSIDVVCIWSTHYKKLKTASTKLRVIPCGNLAMGQVFGFSLLIAVQNNLFCGHKLFLRTRQGTGGPLLNVLFLSLCLLTSLQPLDAAGCALSALRAAANSALSEALKSGSPFCSDDGMACRKHG